MDESMSRRIENLEAQVDELTIQVSTLLSHVIRAGVMTQPLGFHLAEDAVARAFGIDVWDFYGGLPSERPASEEGGPELVMARRTLYNLLRAFLRESARRIALQYEVSRDTVRRSPLSWAALHLQQESLTASERRRYRASGEYLLESLLELQRRGGLVDKRLMDALRYLNETFAAEATLGQLTYADGHEAA